MSPLVFKCFFFIVLAISAPLDDLEGGHSINQDSVSLHSLPPSGPPDPTNLDKPIFNKESPLPFDDSSCQFHTGQ